MTLAKNCPPVMGRRHVFFQPILYTFCIIIVFSLGRPLSTNRNTCTTHLPVVKNSAYRSKASVKFVVRAQTIPVSDHVGTN